MKETIFTEFLELVEGKLVVGVQNTIISQSKLESNGIYKFIGAYPFSEMLQLLQNLNISTGTPIDNHMHVESMSGYRVTNIYH